MIRPRFRRATTLHERRRHYLFGALMGVLTLVLYVPLLGLLSLIDNRLPILEPLTLIVLVGLPIALALIGSRWLGRHDDRKPAGDEP